MRAFIVTYFILGGLTGVASASEGNSEYARRISDGVLSVALQHEESATLKDWVLAEFPSQLDPKVAENKFLAIVENLDAPSSQKDIAFSALLTLVRPSIEFAENILTTIERVQPEVRMKLWQSQSLDPMPWRLKNLSTEIAEMFYLRLPGIHSTDLRLEYVDHFKRYSNGFILALPLKHLEVLRSIVESEPDELIRGRAAGAVVKAYEMIKLIGWEDVWQKKLSAPFDVEAVTKETESFLFSLLLSTPSSVVKSGILSAILRPRYRHDGVFNNWLPTIIKVKNNDLDIQVRKLADATIFWIRGGIPYSERATGARTMDLQPWDRPFRQSLLNAQAWFRGSMDKPREWVANRCDTYLKK